MLSKKKMGVNWQKGSHGWAKQNSQTNMCAASQSSSKVKEWAKRPDEFKPYYETLLPENIGTYCRGWPN